MTRRFLFLLYALSFCVAMSFFSTSVFASHLRGTSVSWSPTGVAGTVQFTIQYSQRTSFGCDAGTCLLGGVISVPFDYGDGSGGVYIPLTITSLNSAEDYLSATGTFTHTYASAGPFTAFYQNSARVSTIKSGHDQNLRMETLVSPMSTNHSPVASMPAIVTVPLLASTGFTVSAADLDGNPLSFRLSTASEMYANSSFSCAAQQPPGLAINNSGQVTWDTTQITAAGCGFSAPVSGDLWTVQFMVEDLDSSNNVKSKIPVDLIIKFNASTEALPTIVFSNPGPITVSPGTPVTFSITANDTTANSRVTFNATGLPIGATATNTNQTLTPPSTSTFSWTPTAAQTGSYVISYTVTNDTFEQTLASVTINVPSVLPPVTTCSTSLTAQYNSAVSIPVQVSDPQGDALTVVWSVDGVTVHTDNVAASTATTSLTLSQAFTLLGTHTVSTTTTDTDNASSSCSTPITVVAADQSIIFSTPPNMIYGSIDEVLSATSTSGLAIAFSASGSCSIVNGAIHANGAGSCSITANQAGNSTYNAATGVTRTIQITPRPLTVTAQSLSRQYGVQNPTFTGSITGIANGDAITATYTTTATINSPVGTYPIVATLAGSALSNYTQTVNNGTLTVTPGPAAKLTNSIVTPTLVSGGNLGTITATINDANNNTVTSSTATVTASITGPGGYSQTVSTSAVGGIASLNLSLLNLNTAGVYSVAFGSSGLTGTSAIVTVTAGAASKVAVSTVPSLLISGGNLGTVTASVKDANGNTVTNSTTLVTATITGPGAYSQTVSGTAVNGVATFNLSSLNLTAAGAYTVTTSSSGLTGTSASVTVTAGAASKLIASAIPSTLVAGNSLGIFTATVQDANGNTVITSTAPVTTTITGPNGYSRTVSTIAVAGVAGINLGSLNLTAAGSYTVTTSSPGLTGTSSSVLVTPGAAFKLANSIVPSTLVAGGNLGILTATVEDANNNTVTTSAAVITTTITGPNGYSHSVTGTAVNGVVNLDLSSLNLLATGTYTVATSGSGLTGNSVNTTVMAGTASKLATGAVVSTVISGGNLGTVAATITDVNGNTVTNSTASVTATITGPNGYLQTTSIPAVNGVASLNLSSFSLNTAGTYTLTTSSSGLTGTNSPVTVTPGNAAKLVLGTIVSGITSGQNLTTVTVTAEDTNGNVATSYSGPITATLTGPDGFSHTVAGTAVSGVAILDLSGITPIAGGSYTLAVTGSGVTAATTSIAVATAPQTVSLPSLPSSTYGTGAIAFPTTSNAGLPITYVVTGPAVMNGSSLTITGAGTITVTATQAGDASHSPVVASTTIVVAKATSSIQISTSGSVATAGSPVLLTAHVTSTTGVPTGTVTFLEGSTVLGTAPITVAGTATLNVSSLPTGVLSLTATYGGDNNYISAASAPTVSQVEDFAIAPTGGTPSVPVVPGSPASFTIALTPASGGFVSPISLSVTGLPLGATYSFAPATATPGSAVASTVLTVQTAKPVSTARNPGSAAETAFALLLFPLAFSRRARLSVTKGRLLSVLAALLLLGSVTGLTGCGTSNGFFGQQAQTYTVTVTGTSGTLVHSTQVILNVQ